MLRHRVRRSLFKNEKGSVSVYFAHDSPQNLNLKIQTSKQNHHRKHVRIFNLIKKKKINKYLQLTLNKYLQSKQKSICCILISDFCRLRIGHFI